MDSRGVSAVLGYVMTLGIVTLLIGGLFLAAGNYVENEHERAVRAEFSVVGNRLAADLAAVDRLALAAGPTGDASLRTDLPARVAGKPYQIELSSTGTPDVYQIDLTVEDPDVSVTIRVKLATTLVGSTVNGGDVIVVYDGTDLEVTDA